MKKEEKLEFFGLERAQFNYFPIIASLGPWWLSLSFVYLVRRNHLWLWIVCLELVSSPEERKFPLQPELSSQFSRWVFCTHFSFTCSVLSLLGSCFVSLVTTFRDGFRKEKSQFDWFFTHFTLHKFLVSSWAPLLFAPSPHFRCCALNASTMQPRRFCEMSQKRKKP